MKRLLLISLTALFLLSTAAALAADAAKITAIVLEVKYRSSANAAWTRAKIGTQLPAGAQVRTGKRSKCEIRFPDRSMVRLAPQTDLQIAKIAGKDMALGHGKLYARIISGTTARISGGTGVASIKGTTLEFDAGEPETAIERRHNVLTIFNGLAELSGPGGTTSVGAGTSSGLGPAGAPGVLGSVPEEKFANGTPRQWWDGMKSGVSVRSMPGSWVGVDFKTQTFSGGRQSALGGPGRFDLDNGSLIIDVSDYNGVARASRPENRVVRASRTLGDSLALASPSAVFDLPPLALAQVSPAREAFGRRFFGPNFLADAFALWGEEQSLAGVRVRPTAVWNNLYFELGGTAYTTFDDGCHTILSEALVTARPAVGDLTAGRQHFFPGPVNNSNLGSLVGFDTADAVRFQPSLGRVDFDLAWVDDFIPFRHDDQSGLYGRAQCSEFGGTFGLNAVHFNGVGTGVSFDFSVSAVAGKWDLYGEFGDDPSGNHLETWGMYFPELYQLYNLDLFMEYARRSNAESLLSLNAYKDFDPDLTGVLSLLHSNEDEISAAIGIIKRFD